MAGIDGIINRIDPGEPVGKDLYELDREELRIIPHVTQLLLAPFGPREGHDFLFEATSSVINTAAESQKSG